MLSALVRIPGSRFLSTGNTVLAPAPCEKSGARRPSFLLQHLVKKRRAPAVGRPSISSTLANPKIESIRTYFGTIQKKRRAPLQHPSKKCGAWLISFSHCTARGRNNTPSNEPPQLAFVTRSPANKNVSYSVLLFLKKGVNF